MRPQGPTHVDGMTLIELMIALVIAAILLSIAIPSYRSYVLRSKRTDATAALLRIQGAQEKFFLQFNRYAANLTQSPPAGLGQLALSDNGYYDLELDVDDAANATEFTARATPRSDDVQSDDTKCAEFSLDHNGVKRAVDDSNADNTAECWR